MARPAFTNVFLGRIGAYMSNNHLGEADGPGEKVVHHTQKCISQLNSDLKSKTRLIAASIRNFEQIPLLCGVDVLTIPAKVAADTVKQLNGPFRSMVDHDFNVVYFPGVVTSRLHMRKLWTVSDTEKRTFQEVAEKVPVSPEELVNHFRQQGLNDIFPELTDAQKQQISDDGKIPNHERWANAIRNGETAIDTLLNLAGLASFASDQQALDERVCEVAGWGRKGD
jgi:transaldolase